MLYIILNTIGSVIVVALGHMVGIALALLGSALLFIRWKLVNNRVAVHQTYETIHAKEKEVKSLEQEARELDQQINSFEYSIQQSTSNANGKITQNEKEIKKQSEGLASYDDNNAKYYASANDSLLEGSGLITHDKTVWYISNEGLISEQVKWAFIENSNSSISLSPEQKAHLKKLNEEALIMLQKQKSRLSVLDLQKLNIQAWTIFDVLSLTDKWNTIYGKLSSIIDEAEYFGTEFVNIMWIRRCEHYKDKSHAAKFTEDVICNVKQMTDQLY
jgi:septal ring factor EnvC (AmiA/AmiB activator)